MCCACLVTLLANRNDKGVCMCEDMLLTRKAKGDCNPWPHKPYKVTGKIATHGPKPYSIEPISEVLNFPNPINS